jgi:hypothetical protein
MTSFQNLRQNFSQNFSKLASTLALIFILTFTTACGGVSSQTNQTNSPVKFNQANQVDKYGQLAKGNSTQGQDFGEWVIKTSSGMIDDAYVRDNNKLGVVISPKVAPTDLKTLAKSLVQGFRLSFPDQDLMVLMYSPNKKLLLTTRYDTQAKQIEYEVPS